MITFNDLNENQRRAVEWNEGPLLVLAGPGSGKTVVLTLRVVRLLEESENASALGLTFTNKAAAEMRDRVDRRLGGTHRSRPALHLSLVRGRHPGTAREPLPSPPSERRPDRHP